MREYTPNSGDPVAPLHLIAAVSASIAATSYLDKSHSVQAGSRGGSRRATLLKLSRTDTQMDGQTLCDNKG